MNWTNTYAVLNDYGREAVMMIADRLHSADHVATGALVDNLSYDIQENGDEIVLRLFHEDYLKYIEGGIQPAGEFNSPGWKAYPAIRQWVQDKNLARDLPEVKKLSFLITRSLFVGYTKSDGTQVPATGIEPDPIVDEVVQKLNERYEPLLAEAISKDIEDEVEVIMTQVIIGTV